MPIVPFQSNVHGASRASIGVYSFGTKNAPEPQRQFAQFEFDVSKLRDPQGQKQFSGSNGLDKRVQEWLKADTRISGLVLECLLIADDLVKFKTKVDGPKTELAQASSWLSLSFKEHHGKWTAPAIAEVVAIALSEAGYNVAIFHRELKDSK